MRGVMRRAGRIGREGGREGGSTYHVEAFKGARHQPAVFAPVVLPKLQLLLRAHWREGVREGGREEGREGFDTFDLIHIKMTI